MSFLSAVLELLFPRKCVFCRRLLQKGEEGVCVACAKDLHNATVKVSVFGESAEQNRVLGHLIRRTHEFERIVNSQVRLKFTPRLRFVIDHSLEKGDRVLALLNSLEQEAAAGDETPPSPPEV